jgi:hypothetical protein
MQDSLLTVETPLQLDISGAILQLRQTRRLWGVRESNIYSHSMRRRRLDNQLNPKRGSRKSLSIWEHKEKISSMDFLLQVREGKSRISQTFDKTLPNDSLTLDLIVKI